MVDDLIREMTEPEASDRAEARSAARSRLMAVLEGRRPRERKRLGRRGLATIIALLAIPSGVAVATELGSDPTLKSAAECPELLGGLEERGLSSKGLMLADCPVGADMNLLLDQMVALKDRLKAVESDGEPVGLGPAVGFGRSTDDEPWSFIGVSGEGEPRPGQ